MNMIAFVLFFSVAFAEKAFIMDAEGMLDGILQDQWKDIFDRMEAYGNKMVYNFDFKQYYFVQHNVCTYIGKNFEEIIKLPTTSTNLKNFKAIKISYDAASKKFTYSAYTDMDCKQGIVTETVDEQVLANKYKWKYEDIDTEKFVVGVTMIDDASCSHKNNILTSYVLEGCHSMEYKLNNVPIMKMSFKYERGSRKTLVTFYMDNTKCEGQGITQTAECDKCTTQTKQQCIDSNTRYCNMHLKPQVKDCDSYVAQFCEDFGDLGQYTVCSASSTLMLVVLLFLVFLI